MRARTLIRITCLLVGVVFLAVLTFTGSSSPAAPPGPLTCDAYRDVAYATAKLPAAERWRFTGKGDTLQLWFDSSRGQKFATIDLSAQRVTETVRPRRRSLVYAEVAGDLVTTERSTSSIHASAIGVTAALSPSGGDLELCVALDPRKVEDLQAGRYQGTLNISGDRVEPVAVAISATFRDPLSHALAWALGGFVFAVALKVLSELSEDVSRAALLDYLRRPSTWVALASGLAVAIYGLAQVYGNNRSWGSADFDGLKLAFSTLLFQVSGVEGIDLLRQVLGGRSTAPAPSIGATASGG